MSPSTRRVLSVLGLGLAGACAIAALVVAFVAFTGIQERSARFMALAGMSGSIALLAALVALLGGVCLLIGRSWRWGLVLVLVPVFVAVPLNAATMWGLVHPERAEDGTSMSVLVQNLWYRNQDPTAAAEATLAQDADVVVLLEYSPDHAAAFAAAGVARQYPHRWEVVRTHGAGIAVFSRFSFDTPVDLGLSGPSARLDMDVGGTDVEFYAVHPNSPSSIYDLPRWQSDMAALVGALDHAGADTVVAGDLNSTSGHRRFRELMRVADLRDVQDVAGGGFALTWPAGDWFPPLLRLDHVLVGPGIGVRGFARLPQVGSDHRGVEAWLRVPRP